MKMYCKAVIKKLIQKLLYRFYPSLAYRLFSQKTHEIVHDNHNTYVIHQSSIPKLADQTALVVGGSGFLGRSIAFVLAAQGADVYIAGSTRQKAEKVVSEINDLGMSASAVVVNLLEKNSIRALVEEVLSKNSRIDILVYCAGGSARDNASELINLDDDIIDHTISLNLLAPIRLAREVGKAMANAKYGRIILIGSTIGVTGKARFSDYAAAKSGLIGFVKSLAMELGASGVTVNLVSPGIVYREKYSDSFKAYLEKTNWMNTVGKAEDVSELVCFLACQEASFITGQNIQVDGGRALGLKGD